MAFTIIFDYRFDSTGFFGSADRRAVLEQAAAQWEAVIRDDFDDLPAGTSFSITNPTTFGLETVTLNNPVDDIVIFVGARDLSNATLAIAGPDGGNAAGDVYSARISSDFRGTGPVTDFEPWAGTISFNSGANWSFTLGAASAGKSDFLSVAVHEIGHVLGVGTSGAFDNWVVGQTFTGPNARSVNNNQPIPVEDDLAHVEDGFAGDVVALDPTLTTGTRVLVSDYDKAILADIGYDIAGFVRQGSTPPIATASAERIFGRDVADVIDGLAGNDSLQGGDGDDRLIGNSGDDDLFGQTGNDTLVGGAGDDYLGGGPGNDALRGGVGNDSYFGQGGTDLFVIGKGEGRNTISDFDLGTETIRLVDSGFASTAEVVSSITKPFSNVSRLTFADGTTVDVFHASQSGTPLTARNFELMDQTVQSGIKVINGNAGPNRLEGGTENEQINGMDGNDTLSGGGGDDTLSGGSGADTFVITSGNRQVTITDYDPSQDILDLTDFTHSEVSSVLETANTGGGVVHTFSSGTKLMIGGTNMSNSAPVGPLTILGDAFVGETIFARPNGIQDADGINYSTQTFQWFRDGQPIFGATQQSYAVSSTDIGSELSVQYSYVDNLGNQETVVSKPEPAVPNSTPTSTPTTGGGGSTPTQDPGTVNPNNSEPVGPLTILGDALVGETLFARPRVRMH